MGPFSVIRTPAFDLLTKEYTRGHPRLDTDLLWLIGRLAQAPELKLVGVARASLEEFLGDYKDLLRQLQQVEWGINHPMAGLVRRLAYAKNRSYSAPPAKRPARTKPPPHA